MCPGDGVEAKATPSLPPPPPSPPPLPPSPPPQHPQGSKRHQDSDEPQAPKRGRSSFAPHVGDWKCGSCGFWNFRSTWKCQGRNCIIDFERSKSVKHKHLIQEEGPGVTKRPSGARERFDWQCKCRRWNKPHYYRCSKCSGGRYTVEIGIDKDESLPFVDRTPSYDKSKDYWTGGSSGPSTSVQHRYENAKYLGVAGRKHHKW